MITTFLFDLDDTLIDSHIYAKIYQPILQMIQKKLGRTISQIEQKAKAQGLVKNKAGRWDTGDLCRELGLLPKYYEILEKEIEIVPILRQEIVPLFQEIKKKRKNIGITSNSMQQTARMYLKRYQLEKYVSFIYSSEDAGCPKGKESYWKQLTEKHQLIPAQCLVVGDNKKSQSQQSYGVFN